MIFTYDLEDHRGFYDRRSRFPALTHSVLDDLDRLGVKGSFYTVGLIAQSHPELVREVVRRGHELGCHSWDHTPLDRQTPEQFRAATAKAKAVLEDVAGMAVAGYRAPIMSLIAKTIWAVDIIGALGFSYSSSIMPAPNPLYGFPQAPRRVFRWPNGLIEVPCAVGRIGPVSIAYLGGVYLRCFPLWLVRALYRRADQRDMLWCYSHPYDFDADEPLARTPGTSLPTNLLLWARRSTMRRKIEALLQDASSGTMESRLRNIDRNSLPVFQFGQAA